MLFCFHDAIIFEIHKDEMNIIKHIKNYMETKHKKIFGSLLPVDVKVGPNFGELTRKDI